MELKSLKDMESEQLSSSSFSVSEVLDIITTIIKDSKIYSEGKEKWIVVRVLRVLMEDFEKIQSVSKANLLKMIEAAIQFREGRDLQDIFGEVEFFGEIFSVEPGVFIPRLSTETLVRTVLKTYKVHKKSLRILDLCSGSGVITITLAKYLTGRVTGVDISEAATKLARVNANRLGVLNAHFLTGDILKPLYRFTSVDAIVSNPPYWSREKVLNAKVDPRIKHGYEAGETGFEFIAAIINAAKEKLFSGGYLFLEVDYDQVETTIKLMSKDFENITVEKDHRNLNRVVYGKLKK